MRLFLIFAQTPAGLVLLTLPPRAGAGERTSMHGRGILLKRDQCPDVIAAGFGSRDAPLSAISSSTLPDACAALCHELSERLTAAGNYLGALERILEIGHRRGQPLPAEVLEKASAEVTRAGETIHQFRRLLANRSKV